MVGRSPRLCFTPGTSTWRVYLKPKCPQGVQLILGTLGKQYSPGVSNGFEGCGQEMLWGPDRDLCMHWCIAISLEEEACPTTRPGRRKALYLPQLHFSPPIELVPGSEVGFMEVDLSLSCSTGGLWCLAGQATSQIVRKNFSPGSNSAHA
jgi:hypothetical protein